MAKSTALVELPEELWLRIFGYLSGTEITIIRRVCRKWHFLSYDNSLKVAIELRISEKKITESNFSKLLSSTDFLSCTDLIIYEQEMLTDEMLDQIVHTNSNIRFLSLMFCHKITDKGFKCIADLKQLKGLHISCMHFSDESIVYLSERVQGLDYLSVDAKYCLTNNSLKAIEHFPNLTYLDFMFIRRSSVPGRILPRSYDLRNLKNLETFVFRTDFPLRKSIISSLRFSNLNTLKFSNLPGKSDDALSVVLKNTQSLKNLDLDECRVSGKFIYTPHNLKELHLNYCKRLNADFYDFFKKKVEFDYFLITITPECDVNTSFSFVKELQVMFSTTIFDFSNYLPRYSFLNSNRLVTLSLISSKNKDIVIDQSCLETVFSTCQSLKELLVLGINFSNTSSLSLQENLSIRIFTVHSLKNVDETAVEKMAVALPNLLSVTYYGEPNFIQTFKKHCNYLLKGVGYVSKQKPPAPVPPSRSWNCNIA